MIEILNKLRQPLIINLNDGTALHLLAREKAEITAEQFKSVEVKMYLTNGDIVVLRMN
jgi:hypothetical protein